jgi:hypothetical protein
LLGAALLTLLAPVPGHAAGVVTNCTAFGSGAGTLQAALTGGGTITFACSGTIVFPRSFLIEKPTVIDGRGQKVVLSGNNTTSLLFVFKTTLELIELTLTDAVAKSGAGPAVFVGSGSSATITRCTITRNSTTQSGAVLLDSGALSLTIVDSAITDNTAEGQGAGVYAGDGLLTIENSTLSGNRTTGKFGYGPAIAVAGSKVTAIVTNSTVSGNLGAKDSGAPAAIFSNGALTLVNTTVTGNDGGGIRRNTGTVTLRGSIVANQLAGPDCETPGVVSDGFNLDSDGTCGLTETGDLPKLDPLLGPLQDNGGSTPTHALLPDSPALNAGPDTDCPPTDQRGIARPHGSACDIGAFEFNGLLAEVALDGSALAKGDTITYRGTVSPGPEPILVDIYLGALLPDLKTFVSLVESAPGRIDVVTASIPVRFRANVPAEALSAEFKYTYGGGEPGGTYHSYVAVVAAGGDPLLPANQLSLAVEAFTYSP